jgi:hypothetical protein
LRTKTPNSSFSIFISDLRIVTSLPFFLSFPAQHSSQYSIPSHILNFILATTSYDDYSSGDDASVEMVAFETRNDTTYDAASLTPSLPLLEVIPSGLETIYHLIQHQSIPSLLPSEGHSRRWFIIRDPEIKIRYCSQANCIWISSLRSNITQQPPQAGPAVLQAAHAPVQAPVRRPAQQQPANVGNNLHVRARAHPEDVRSDPVRRDRRARLFYVTTFCGIISLGEIAALLLISLFVAHRLPPTDFVSKVFDPALWVSSTTMH